MIALVLPLTALLAGVALLLAGSGLLGTLLAIRGRAEGYDDQTLGLVMSGYFVGFLIGTFLAPPLIRRIGHIRAFAFYATLCAAAVLLHPIWLDPWSWVVLRIVVGAGLVGLYTVIESWLNAQTAPEQRSQVFAVYMVVNLLALALGQQLLGLSAPEGFVLFSLVAILICAAALPVTATRLAQPMLPAAPRLHPLTLFRSVPAAAAGALLSGLAMGGFWGLGPVYASRLGLDVSGVATFMSLTILGGAALQWPIGRLSDRGDRRTTLALICALAAVTALLAIPAADIHAWALFALYFAYGGLAFAIYPVCVAHLLDHLPAEALLAGCSSLLLFAGIGSALGPMLAGAAMGRFGPHALPAYFAVMLGLLTVIAGGRRLLHRRRRPHPAHFHPMLRTTPSALELLPETESEPEAEPAPYSTAEEVR